MKVKTYKELEVWKRGIKIVNKEYIQFLYVAF